MDGTDFATKADRIDEDNKSGLRAGGEIRAAGAAVGYYVTRFEPLETIFYTVYRVPCSTEDGCQPPGPYKRRC